MDAVRRGGADGTGEQDVRALRHEFGEDVPALPIFKDSGPHVRAREDVPHEHALPDLWDDQELADEDIEAVLFEMVDSGELVCGWIPERGEFGFWVPEPTQEPVQQAPTAGRHRKLAVSKVGLAVRGSFLVGLAMISAPVAMAIGTSAARHHVKKPSVEAPDVSPDVHTDGAVIDKPSAKDYATPHVPESPTHTPRRPAQSAPRTSVHRRVIPAVEFLGQKAGYVGKHRKPSATVYVAPEANRQQPQTQHDHHDQGQHQHDHGQHDHHGHGHHHDHQCQHQHPAPVESLLSI
jgi:hypothetical protein